MGFLAKIAAGAVLAVALSDPSSRMQLVDLTATVVDTARQAGVETVTNGAAADTHGQHAFSYGTEDRPGRWNPCKPITYAISERNLPAGGVDVVHRQIATIEAASGLDFKFQGVVSDRVSSSHLPRAAAGRAAQVLIGWSAAEDTDLLNGGTQSANTGLAARTSGGLMSKTKQIVAAVVALDSRYADHELRDVTVLHELGHVAGLDHVSDRSQVMQPVPSAGQQLGAGDRAGLHALGQGHCL